MRRETCAGTTWSHGYSKQVNGTLHMILVCSIRNGKDLVQCFEIPISSFAGNLRSSQPATSRPTSDITRLYERHGGFCKREASGRQLVRQRPCPTCATAVCPTEDRDQHQWAQIISRAKEAEGK